MSQNSKSKGVWVWVKWVKDAPVDAWKEWSNGKQWQIWNTTGEWDSKIWLESKNLEGIQETIWNEIRSNKWVSESKTELAWKLAD